MSKASAPGKIILFGEHAVVYSRPALAVPVPKVHADVEITDSPNPGLWVEAPGIALNAALATLAPTDALRTVIERVFQTLGVHTPPALHIKITSTIPVASGLGSGAAVSVALIRALGLTFGQALTDEQVNTLAYEIEKLHHGTPSGIDNTVITYGKPVYFVRGQTIETFHVGKAFTLVIGNTGVVAPTKETVGAVRQRWQAHPTYWEKIFDQVGQITNQARSAIETGETASLGPLMDANHALLQTMGVSSPELDTLVTAAKESGAMGAKLSGGGGGGNMIALVEPQKAESIAGALEAAGAVSTIITTIQ